MQRISITIEDDIKHHLDKVVSKGDRARFVNGAIKEALAARERQKALDMLLNFPRYEIRENAVETLKKSGRNELRQLLHVTE